MRRRIGSGIGSIGLLACVSASAHSGTPPPLTLEARVEAQRAIEEVFWRHRIWPSQNPQPKPTLDRVMTDAQIRDKVERDLETSRILEIDRARAISPEQLEAEVDRMRRETRQPDVLAEIFAALHDDPVLIAECLARPFLADRLAAEVQTANEHGRSIEDAGGASLPAPLTADTWSATKLSGAPTARHQHTAVWTGAEMIVWGGLDASDQPLASGGRYVPATNSWISMPNLPSARWDHTAVWSGIYMVVWGGDTTAGRTNTGGRYDPQINTWLPVSTGTNVPSPRRDHTTVWTGTQMIVWGGFGSTYLRSGGRYDPSSDIWSAMNMADAPTAREGHKAVWTSSEMIVWGGNTGFSIFNTGGRYEPSSDTWTPTSVGANVPTPRTSFSAVWTGSRMMVWGGADLGGIVNTGGLYDPSTDSWTPTGTGANVPSARKDHTAVWTDTAMIVWGGIGFGDGSYRYTGGRYNPATDTWTETSLDGAPSPRTDHTAVWTGQEMVVWGGADSLTAFNTGGRYTPCSVMIWYQDADGDEYGNPAAVVYDCTQPAGYVPTADDCDDGHSTAHPGAPEMCDGLDNNCDGTIDNAAPPAGVAALAVSEPASGNARLTWSSVPSATAYDLVRGSLDSLAASGGDFTVATQACLGDDVPPDPVDDSGGVPPGTGVWYLVRPVNCGGAGTYDSGAASQAGSRDAEIQASPSHCP